MKSKIDKIEDFLQDQILTDLRKGRPNWDEPHTKAVVHYVKEIIRNSPEIKINSTVVIIAAYAHDWGYIGLFDESIDYDKIMKMKKEHMRVGAQKIEELLKNEVFSELTEVEKIRIIHLVSIHDELKDLKDIDELVLMEADTLGALDTNFVKITDIELSKSHLKGLIKKRQPIFITKYGKAKLKEFIKQRHSLLYK